MRIRRRTSSNPYRAIYFAWRFWSGKGQCNPHAFAYAVRQGLFRAEKARITGDKSVWWAPDRVRKMKMRRTEQRRRRRQACTTL